ncbi:MAG: hypothetical protein ACFFAS_12500 [Promethearchaeota archaeon]
MGAINTFGKEYFVSPPFNFMDKNDIASPYYGVKSKIHVIPSKISDFFYVLSTSELLAILK